MTDLLPMMPGYEAYKDSGVEWIGEIPEHWDQKRFKFFATATKGRLPNRIVSAVEIHTPVYMTMGYLRGGDANQWVLDSNAEVIGSNEVLLLWDGSNSGEFIKSRKGVLSSTVAFIKFSGVTRDFGWYFSNVIEHQLRASTVGMGIPHVNGQELKNSIVLYPPHHEQTAIADFLDCKTVKIDQAIAIKEKQISLLKERRQILIQNAVTQGLDPDVPLRDSGVEWIGEIPVHWKIKRAKYLFKEVDERSTTGKEELLSVSHMTGVTPRSEKNVSMFMAEDYTGSKTCQKEDLVFNIMWTWMGALGVSGRPGIVSSSYGIFRQREKDRFNPKYLEYLLKTTGYVEHYNRVSTGLHSSRLRFYGHMFLNMEIGFPDRKEQDEIIIHIQTQSTKIDKAIALQEQMIDKLKEYKATLINSAVTGKIKVLMPKEVNTGD